MDEKKTTESAHAFPRGLQILFIVLGLWALLIAGGAVWGQGSSDIARPLVVVGTMAFFLSVWATALWARRRP